jgi:hypothetical protein
MSDDVAIDEGRFRFEIGDFGGYSEVLFWPNWMEDGDVVDQRAVCVQYVGNVWLFRT